jgi:hypothetical protein
MNEAVLAHIEEHLFTPDAIEATFEAETRFDKLFTGVVVPPSAWKRTPGAGTEHIRPEDVEYGGENDADYGKLLEKAIRA